jgi:peptidoglycan hydrolase-like protein with peptidoglycan-binding domain
MANPTLRQGTGFSNSSPELREDVKRLQMALKEAGYSVDTDGLFGEGTEGAVKALQRDRGLNADGIVGAATWGALEGNGTVSTAADGTAAPGLLDVSSVLAGFRGDAQWVHDREGHVGKPCWPGGNPA